MQVGTRVNRRITKEQVPVIRERAAAGEKLRVLADELGVGVSAVSTLVRGLTFAKEGGPISPTRFSSRVPVLSETGCLEAKKFTTRMRRVAYVRAHGPVLRSERVEATCGNSKCINPEHLVRAFDLRRPLTPELARDMRAAYRRSPRPLTHMGQEYGLSPYRAWYVLTSPKLDGLGEPPIPVRSRREAEP